MDKTEIYYFSGTGNSLAAARDLAEKLTAELISVALMKDKGIIDTEANVIGFVFPIYDFKPPRMIIDFLSRIKNLDAKYIFAICTYGIAPYRSLKYLEKIIKSLGGYLSVGFAVRMPHNGIGSNTVPKTEYEKMYMDWDNRLDDICESIVTGRKGKIESGYPVQFRIIRMMPSLVKFISHIVRKGIKSLELTSGDDCNGCGICTKICPENNIEIIGHKPEWSDHCAGCWACLHWCPKKAISLGGNDMNIRFYHHPNIDISDMIKN